MSTIVKNMTFVYRLCTFLAVLLLASCTTGPASNTRKGDPGYKELVITEQIPVLHRFGTLTLKPFTSKVEHPIMPELLKSLTKNIAEQMVFVEHEEFAPRILLMEGYITNFEEAGDGEYYMVLKILLRKGRTRALLGHANISGRIDTEHGLQEATKQLADTIHRLLLKKGFRK